ncbi:protease [Caulobacter phage Jess A]|nr:protease [Caulobacter phage Jess A]QNH91700.1 protease [Caulobacter phage SR18]WCA46457.1 endoprotease [Caulobacter phage RapA]
MATENDAPNAEAPAPAAPSAADTGLTNTAAADGQGDTGQGDDQNGQTSGTDDGAGQGTGTEEGAASGGDAQGGDPPTEGDGAGDAQGAPEQYADFTLPDGYALPDDIRAALTETAKGLNLTQEAAQQLVDLGAKQATAIMGALASDPGLAFTALGEQWGPLFSAQTQADPAIGGEKLGETMALAGKAFTHFATPELTTLLRTTGLEHHPEIIRLMHNVGKVIAPDKLVTPERGRRSGETARVDAKSLYPNSNHN